MTSRVAKDASWILLGAFVLGPSRTSAAPAPPPKTTGVQDLASPDGHLTATIAVGDDVRYALALDGRALIAPSPVSMTLADGRVLGRRSKLLRVDRSLKAEEIATPIGKRAKVRNAYREAALLFADGATLRARIFDDGFALRWETGFIGRIRVKDEGFEVVFPEQPQAFFLGGEGAHHGYEGLWRHEPISALWSWSAPAAASLPLVFDLPGGAKLALLQADLDNYPAMYLTYRLSQPRSLVSFFPRRATKEQPGGFLNFDLVVTERADDIAETAGTRSFPWRAFVLARRDADLLASDMVTRLAPPPALVPLVSRAGASEALVPLATDWVKPGQVVWDYWANWNLEGVEFVAGRNTATFKHHVDFAAKHGFPYVNIDWFWTDPLDLMALNPEIDVPEIVRYAREKGVGVFVWCLARTLEAQLAPALDRAQKWGVAGLKIDFFDRDDQRMIALYQRFAAEAAKRKLLVLFHGATAPWGLSRAYPNVMGYEAVRGLEYDKFDEQGAPPPHDVTLPFTRMLAGPMDYTPGAMRALNKSNWKAVGELPSAQGTVAHQLAMYVVYDAPLVMLSDMPSAYEKEPAALEMLAAVPTTWDETVGVDGRIGESAVVARRKGDEWWIGAMTDWSARTFEVPLGFTGGGTWEATLWTDGVNADKVGTDYRRSTQSVEATASLRLALAPGGGAVVRLRRK
jgi:alpha-glucosidase